MNVYDGLLKPNKSYFPPKPNGGSHTVLEAIDCVHEPSVHEVSVFPITRSKDMVDLVKSSAEVIGLVRRGKAKHY